MKVVKVTIAPRQMVDNWTVGGLMSVWSGTAKLARMAQCQAGYGTVPVPCTGYKPECASLLSILHLVNKDSKQPPSTLLSFPPSFTGRIFIYS